MSKKEKPLFTRGYSELTNTLKKKSRYIRHCNNCHFFYSELAIGDEEVCQNDFVLPYDIVVDGTTIFCHYWKPCEEPKQAKEEKEDDYLARFKRGLKR